MNAPASEAVAQPCALDIRMFTVKQTREMTGLGNTTVYHLLASGALKAKKCGTRTLVTGESIAAYLRSLPDAVITTGCMRGKRQSAAA